MKITFFNGSPHAERGNTQAIANAFAEGAKSAGAEVESVFLARKELANCRACMSCWSKTPGACAIKDDGPELARLFMEADIVAFVTPVYIDNVTGLTKTFIDRLIPVIDPHMIDDATGVRHPKRYEKYPRVAVISSGGFPDLALFDFVIAYFRQFAVAMHSEVVARICRSQAVLLKQPDEAPLKPVVDNYMKLCAAAGEETVRNGRMSDETQAKLEQPLVPRELYIAEANRFWDKRIAGRDKSSGAS